MSSPLISVHSISKSHGTVDLFFSLSFAILSGDRIGLIGPNGAGKSTLLKILIGDESPDEGYVSKKQGLHIGYCSQMPEFPSLSPLDILIQEGSGDIHEKEVKARILLSKVQFDDVNIPSSTLSGGWKKRLDIARALMKNPDLLLLDEPTNHLDIEGILWLEKFLQREKISYLVVSHDRAFLENVTNKIIEINPCYPNGLFISEGAMETFLKRKEEFLEAQRQYQRGLASEVRDEIAWLRTSPKARTTKSTARVQKAHELIAELSEVEKRNTKQKVDLEFTSSERETRKLIVAKNLTKSLGGKTLFKNIDLTLSPGTRLGILGKNGTGKTTLLKTLAKEIAPDQGTLKYADDLKIVYFDQHRESVSPKITLREALSPHGDYVNYRGQSIHVNGWGKKFLFSPKRMELPVGYLSGGERARILIAKLILEPADVLFLDEPTNDLDIDTLEVIEDSLKDFPGAVVLISHDRSLMDSLCNKFIGLGEGNEQQFYPDFRQWEKAVLASPVKKEEEKKTAISTPPPAQTSSKKLSYKEKRELEVMEASIEKTEQEIAHFQKELSNSSLNPAEIHELYIKLSAAEKQLEYLFIRWQELENLK